MACQLVHISIAVKGLTRPVADLRACCSLHLIGWQITLLISVVVYSHFLVFFFLTFHIVYSLEKSQIHHYIYFSKFYCHLSSLEELSVNLAFTVVYK